MEHQAAYDWAEALRSNKYTQIKGLLRDDVGYCAIGVLEDINGTWWNYDSRAGFYRTPSESGSTLSLQLGQRLMMNNCAGALPFYMRKKLGVAINISYLNDNDVPFYQLADLIEYFWHYL